MSQKKAFSIVLILLCCKKRSQMGNRRAGAFELKQTREVVWKEGWPRLNWQPPDPRNISPLPSTAAAAKVVVCFVFVKLCILWCLYCCKKCWKKKKKIKLLKYHEYSCSRHLGWLKYVKNNVPVFNAKKNKIGEEDGLNARDTLSVCALGFFFKGFVSEVFIPWNGSTPPTVK